MLLGFIVFLAFTSYDQSRTGAEAEALIVTQQVETAQLLPRPVSASLTGDLVCYARSVVQSEWPRMRSGALGDGFNPWAVAMFRTIQVEIRRQRSQSVAPLIVGGCREIARSCAFVSRGSELTLRCSRSSPERSEAVSPETRAAFYGRR